MSSRFKLALQMAICALALLSIFAGIPKVLRMPQELKLLAETGLTGIGVLTLGVFQILGGLLMFMRQLRSAGASLAGLGFVVSSIAIFISGNITFGLVSLLPIAFLLAAVSLDKRGVVKNAT